MFDDLTLDDSAKLSSTVTGNIEWIYLQKLLRGLMDSVKPKVSLIVPIYNVEPYLEECLNSVLAQTLSAFEAILIDDGSPDRSGGIADEFAARDGRMKVIHKQNEGVSAARNDGICHAMGEYLFFLDSDDRLAPDALEKLYTAATENDVDVVLSDYITFDAERETPYKVATSEFSSTKRSDLDALQLAVFNMGPASIPAQSSTILRGVGAAWHYLIKRDLIVDNDLRFDTTLKGLFDDGLFMLTVLERASSVSYINIGTYFYRHVPSSITRSFNSSLFERYDKVYEAIDAFIERYDKCDNFKRGLALRKFIYLNKSMNSYFFNDRNPATTKQLYDEFVKLVRSPSYAGALRELDPKHLGCKKTIALYIMLRMHFYRGYWQAKKFSNKT